MSRDKLLHCKKKVKHRGLRRLAPLLFAAVLANCSWIEGDEPTPAEGDGEYPNLASVPERPNPDVLEDASLLQAGLRADRANARYDEAPLAPSTAAGVTPPPPVSIAPAVTYMPAVTTAAPVPVSMDGGMPPDVAVLASPPAIATPTAVAVAPVVAVPTAGVPAVPVAPAPDNVASYSVDAPIATTSSLPPSPSPVQVITRPTSVIPEPSQLSAVPPSPAQVPYGQQASPYQQQPVPAQSAYGQQASPYQAGTVQQAAIVNPVILSLNLAAGSALPASVIYFANGSSSVSSAEVAKVYQVAQVHAGRGGYVRVVGHSSMRTGEMNLARRDQANLEVSWARANSVADALLRYGVPANAMMVSAVSDSQPVYLENMPSGEAGNRRVEIYLE